MADSRRPAFCDDVDELQEVLAENTAELRVAERIDDPTERLALLQKVEERMEAAVRQFGNATAPEGLEQSLRLYVEDLTNSYMAEKHVRAENEVEGWIASNC